jgi:hypothetical protein
MLTREVDPPERVDDPISAFFGSARCRDALTSSVARATLAR